MIKFDLKDDEVKAGMALFNTKVMLGMKMYAETAAKNFENYAKENRPWTDRTGMARQRLTGYVEEIDKGYRINIAHGVDYGLWLEFAHEKRFAIVKPTIELRGNEVLKGYADLLNKMGY